MKNEVKQWLENADGEELDTLLGAQEGLPLPREASYRRLRKQVLLKCGLRQEREGLRAAFRGLSLCACFALVFVAVLAAQGMVRRQTQGVASGETTDQTQGTTAQTTPQTVPTSETGADIIFSLWGDSALGNSGQDVDRFLSHYASFDRKPGVCVCNADMETARKHCRNVTPADIAEKTDLQIFKFTCEFNAYLLKEDEIIELHSGFGGWGLYSILLCDFDENGVDDLLFTASWGSGLHRAELWHLNLETMERTMIPVRNDLDGYEAYAIVMDDVYLATTVEEDAIFLVSHLTKEIYGRIIAGPGGLPAVIRAE